MTPDAAERRARALLDGHSLARDAAPDLARDVLALADALRALAAQHAADVAAASRSTRESCAATLRARAECLRRYAYEATAKADATEYTHDASEVDACAAIVASVAIAAPTTVPAALLDVAAIEARAAAATCPRCHGRGTVYDSTPAGYLVERQCVACLGAGRPSSDVLALLAAQHAADVAAAVAGERERAVAVCRAVADGWERASVTAKVDTGLALIRAEGATECADALAAPTGGGE